MNERDYINLSNKELIDYFHIVCKRFTKSDGRKEITKNGNELLRLVSYMKITEMKKNQTSNSSLGGLF